MWPSVKLSKIPHQVKREAAVESHLEYDLLGARWYAKGLYVKETKSASQIKASKLYQVREGDFVYNRLFAWKGSFAVASKADDGCWVSNEFPCFHINREKIEPKYLWYYFSRESAWNEALDLSYGATPTSRNRLNEKQFLSLEIPLPPLSEQRRIVAKIERLARKVEEAHGLRQHNLEVADALFVSTRANVMGDALSKAQCPITEIATLERGKFSHRPRNDPRFFGGKYPWIQIGGIEASDKFISTWSQTLNDEGLAISRKFPKGTLLISIAATIGAVGILDFDCCIPDSIVAITPNQGFDSEFIYHYLGYLRTHLEEVAPQSTQKNINLKILSTLPFPLVSLEEQKKIVVYLNRLDRQVNHLNIVQDQTKKELDALLPSILDRAFKGEL